MRSLTHTHTHASPPHPASTRPRARKEKGESSFLICEGSAPLREKELFLVSSLASGDRARRKRNVGCSHSNLCRSRSSRYLAYRVCPELSTRYTQIYTCAHIHTCIHTETHTWHKEEGGTDNENACLVLSICAHSCTFAPLQRRA